MCVVFFPSFICLHVYAYAFKSKIHCGSALGPGAFGLPYYCAPLVCVPASIGGLAVWRHNKPKNQPMRGGGSGGQILMFPAGETRFSPEVAIVHRFSFGKYPQSAQT